jgi:hypothetical protein
VTPLASWLLAALLTWSPARTHPTETPAQWESRAAAIADDVAGVVTDPVEGACGTCATRGLVVLAVGFQESNYDARVEEGRCRPHTCDNGRAWSAWQIQTDTGITFDGTRVVWAHGRTPAWLLDHPGDVISGPMLVLDRKLAARVALHVWRTAPSLFSTLKAVRLVVATWTRLHPFGAP